MNGNFSAPLEHSFIRSPHKTLISMSLPVLLSLVAEPLTGLVDTAFVARLGSSVPLAALGVGAMVLSSVFWAFNFLGIGTQTQIAQALGKQQESDARQTGVLAILLGAGMGALAGAACFPFVPILSSAMGTTGDVHYFAVRYLNIRLIGAPAVLISIAAFGVLRGLMDMRTPLGIAVFINALNILLDALLIFGCGPIPAMDVAGAALATVISQWLGAIWSVFAVYRKLGWPGPLCLKDAKRILVVGRDLFFRTGMIFLFLLLTTRAATRIGPEAGAAHQVIRQIWLLTALFLDAFAVSGQSLIGYFFGRKRHSEILRVARVVCGWSAAVGFLLSLSMWVGRPLVSALLVPAGATAVFNPAWTIAVLTQPFNALAFATDGIHWGTGDYRYLRNAACLASVSGIAGMLVSAALFPRTLARLWIIILGWLLLRALFGVIRIWPGIGRSPFKPEVRSSP